ncbi:hypothetical protein [Nonomuraea helvata]|uniref:DUF2188 domain-containing protein n=1 Tax=Nonomuraea helvata TaxID=37484 RepID=A0ABV5S5Z0_9ACTN
MFEIRAKEGTAVAKAGTFADAETALDRLAETTIGEWTIVDSSTGQTVATLIVTTLPRRSVIQELNDGRHRA